MIPSWIGDGLAFANDSRVRCQFAVMAALYSKPSHVWSLVELQRLLRGEYSALHVGMAVESLAKDGRIETWETGRWAPTRIALPSWKFPSSSNRVGQDAQGAPR
jgi:hypothetical protein